MGSVERTPYLTLNIPQAVSLSTREEEPSQFNTVVELLDFRARTAADRTAVGFPSCRADERCLAWTYEDLRRVSIEYASHLLHFLKPAHHIVALLAPSGPEFLAHTLACWRLGLAALPIAIGTTTDGILSLLESTGTCVIFAHATQQEQAEEVVARSKKKGATIESCPWMPFDEQASKYGDRHVAHRTVGPDDTLVIFHSSGSSGTPKPIIHPHRFWAWSTATAHGVEAAAFTTTPLFHGGLSDLLRSFQAGSSLFCYSWHEGKAPTAQNVLTSIRSCPVPIRYFLSVPFILEMLTKDIDGRAMLQSMDLVSTGGAPLPKQVGDAMVNEHNIRLVSRMGSSECGFLMSSWREDYDDDKDWQWLRIHDQRTHKWLQFQRREEDGLHELVVSREWPTKLLSNTEDGAFSTNDLFEKHPAREGWWRYVRRADDSIVMVNGKKVASTPIEDALKMHDFVKDAIVFGADRPLLGAIIQCEQHRAASELAEVLREINKNLPTHAQLVQEMIVSVDISDPEEIFGNLPRSSKGTLQRGLALQKLAGLINRTYRQFEQGDAPCDQKRLALRGDSLVEWLTEKISDIAGRSISPEVDLYSAGVDSIMAARLRAAIHQHIELGGLKLTPNAVYDQQNLRSLAKLIERREGATASIKETADKILERFSDIKDFDFSHADANPKANATVLLTGATGALGSRILQALMHSDQVSDIICLVRAHSKKDARERLREALSRRSVPEVKHLSSVQVITTLEDVDLQRLIEAPHAVVIHCAWIVNFALSLKSFEEDCLQALHALFKAYSKCKTPSHFLFCSSLAAVQDGGQTEKYSDQISDAGTTGYGQSKWVAEQMCRSLSKVATVARVGQLCGDMKAGHWNETEAWPLLIRSANEIGALPAVGPAIDWLPVDLAAKAIVDIAIQPPQSSVVHIALPNPINRPSWSTFLDWLASSSIDPFEVVPNREWLAKVEAAGDRVKGRALLPIWSALSNVDVSLYQTTEAEKQSLSMRTMQTVNEALCHKFVLAWKASGFL
jgi:thioester reductase-like protein